MARREDSDLCHSYKIDPSVLALLTNPPRGPDLKDSPADILWAPLPKGPEETPLLAAPPQTHKGLHLYTQDPLVPQRFVPSRT